jgi:hypothetical protein
MQHPNKCTCNIRLEKTQMKHWKQKLATYVFNYCNIYNIAIYFCNFSMKHLKHTSKTLETLETYACNMGFEHNISLLFRNGGSSAHGVHRCRAHRWRGDRHDRFGGEGQVGPRALEGHGGLAAPRDSHPRLPPTRGRGSSSPCSSPTRRLPCSHAGLRSHHFLPRARASKLLSPCLRTGSWQPDAGSAVIVRDAGHKSV